MVSMLALLAAAGAAYAQVPPAAPLPPLPAPAASSPAVELPSMPAPPQLPNPPVTPGATAGEPSALPLPAAQLPATPPPTPAQPTAEGKKAAGIGALIGGVAGAMHVTDDAPSTLAVPEKLFSYGNSKISLLFLPAQVERMKDSIRVFESVSHEAKPVFSAPEPVLQVAEKITEPKDYPVFYLSSIAYDTPGDWSLWVSGHKITSRKNNTDLKVVSVTRDSASFVWTPSYLTAINRRRESEQFAPTDAVKNKLAAVQNIRQEEGGGPIAFTLRQNQTFAIGYFSIFEGYMDTPSKMPVLTEGLPNSLQQSVDRLNSPAPGAPTDLNQPPPGAMPPSSTMTPGVGVPPAPMAPTSLHPNPMPPMQQPPVN